MPDQDVTDEVLLSTAKLNVRTVRDRTPPARPYPYHQLLHVELLLGNLIREATERTTDGND